MYTSDNDDKLFRSQIDDAIGLCEKRQKPYFFSFLTERQQAVARQYMDSIHFPNYRFYGGYDDCERAVLGLWFYDEIEEYPVSALEITFRKADKLTHRDFLGALMSLGIERETIGDILVEDGRCIVFVKSEIKDYILSQLFKIGNAGVKIHEAEPDKLPQGRGFEELNLTVSSLRLDNVVAAVSGLSRDKTKQCILSGNVTLNFLPCENVSKSVSEGDSLSIRGKGKYKISGVLGETKKHRIRIKAIHFR